MIQIRWIKKRVGMAKLKHWVPRLLLMGGLFLLGLLYAAGAPRPVVFTPAVAAFPLLPLAQPRLNMPAATPLADVVYLPLVQEGQTAALPTLQSPTPTSTSTPQATAAPTPSSTPQVWIRAATVETQPVPHSGDAADDPAIWLHPQNRNLSTIIGTDKKGGVAVYNLDGSQLQYLADGKLNNVDLRDGFSLAGQAVTLVTAGNRTNNSIAIYRVNATTRRLESVAARIIQIGLVEAYGSCMYHSSVTGKYYVVINDPTGAVEQWELFDNGSGQVDATLVRTFVVGSQTEGCVADDELGQLYISEEQQGIWKYNAEPDGGDARRLVDATGANGHLTPDVEGLTVYQAANGAGYLIASSQGSDEFVVYQRTGNNAYVVTFNILPGNGIDGVTGTDGIDVTSVALGTHFPQGLFVVQDGMNDQGNQNYKLVPWPAIATTVSPTLSID